MKSKARTFATEDTEETEEKQQLVPCLALSRFDFLCDLCVLCG
jgi:hypothetical protein